RAARGPPGPACRPRRAAPGERAAVRWLWGPSRDSFQCVPNETGLSESSACGEASPSGYRSGRPQAPGQRALVTASGFDVPGDAEIILERRVTIRVNRDQPRVHEVHEAVERQAAGAHRRREGVHLVPENVDG